MIGIYQQHMTPRKTPRLQSIVVKKTCLKLVAGSLMALVVAIMMGGWSASVRGQERSFSDDELKFFENEVRPLLIEHCLECHGESKQAGSLRLDSREAILVGGESGAAVDEEDPTNSLLIEAIHYEGIEMPPSGPLEKDAVETLTLWVTRGLPWPSQAAPLRIDRENFSDEDREWWALQPVVEHSVPALSESLSTDGAVDAFIVASMQDHGLSPAPMAERSTLIRRLYFDMLGVPPTPEEVMAFANDSRDDAWNRLVDQVLEDRRYGERWAQHWLDLVRYADSDGYRADGFRPHAWRYRDYVVDSLNQDKPYDRFIQEQLAADELFPEDVEAQFGLGYLRQGVYEFNQRDARGQWNTILNDITDTTGDVFLGLGMQCAKCHDHKYDPILQRDYYRLRAFFEPVLLVDHEIVDDNRRAKYQQELAGWEALTVEIRRSLEELEKPYREKAEAEAVGRFPEDIQMMIRKPVSERGGLEHQLAELAYRQVFYEYDNLDGRIKGDDKERRDALLKELATHDGERPQDLPIGMIVEEVPAKELPKTVIPGTDLDVQPGFLSIIDSADIEAGEPSARTSGRRAALAKWMTSPENPLTTRVIVNRVWQHHFGKGLAPNPSDLGVLGGLPSHPQLLDWLTVQFVRDGWSLKKLHRRILESHTYRQSSSHPRAKECETIDPENRYYWRWDVRRLDAEQVRDALLAVSGRLSGESGGEGFTGNSNRRAIYRRIFRNTPEPLLEVFDLPQYFLSESNRNTTTTPVQALLLVNSEELLQHARSLANYVVRNLPDGANRETFLWQVVHGREPEPAELEGAQSYLQIASEWIEEENGREREKVDRLELAGLANTNFMAVDFNSNKLLPRLEVSGVTSEIGDRFRIEAAFQIRSIYDSGMVRTIAASGDSQKGGWALGITGKGSRRKPQIPVIQLWGRKSSGQFGEAALFADIDIQLNRPYLFSIEVRPAVQGRIDEAQSVIAEAGLAIFTIQSLDQPEAQPIVLQVEHDLVGEFSSDLPLMLGARDQDGSGAFDGLLGRFRVESPSTIADASEQDPAKVRWRALGSWDFSDSTDLFRDVSGNGFHLRRPSDLEALRDSDHEAFVDLCHAILNANEFFYVD